MFASGTEKGRWREVDPELEPQDTGCISHVDTEAIRFSHFGDLLLCLPGRPFPNWGIAHGSLLFIIQDVA